jgi:hypothetical protein
MVEDMGSILQKVGFFSVIGNRISNTSYHLQYLYCQGGYVFGANANLITFVAGIFLSERFKCEEQSMTFVFISSNLFSEQLHLLQ